MVGYGRLLESVGGKVSIRLPVFSQAAGRWPSWVTQMRGGLFNVKPSLSEKAADHLPLSGPTNTLDAGQISSFPAVFQPQASKAKRKGRVRMDILARGQVACVLGCVYAWDQSTLHVVSTPHPTLPAFCSAWPPACTASAYSNSRLLTITIITAWAKQAHACHFLRLCTLLPALSFLMIFSHATDQRHSVGKSADRPLHPLIY